MNPAIPEAPPHLSWNAVLRLVERTILDLTGGTAPARVTRYRRWIP